jgi:eukaryotic-like serine/threonine-protein kinase
VGEHRSGNCLKTSRRDGDADTFERIRLFCAAFREEWEAGVQPALGTYLPKVYDDDRSTLLRNLLHIEIEFRRATGQHPNATEYLERFPEYATLVRDAFLESMEETLLTGKVDTASSKPREFKAPSVNRLGNYQLIRELGRGAMGFVYEARHIQHGNQVALKTLPSVDGASLQLFKREFRSLADINHPNLIGLHTLEAVGSQWFFTMDLIDGVDFLSYVRGVEGAAWPHQRSRANHHVCRRPAMGRCGQRGGLVRSAETAEGTGNVVHRHVSQ